MKHFRSCMLALALVIAAAPLSAQQPPAPAPAPVDPVGTFDFSTSVDGTAVTGMIRIAKTESGFGGVISTDATGEMPISKVTVEGSRVQIRSVTPDGELVINVDFKDDKFTGGWDMGGMMSGSLTGARRKPAGG